MVMGKEKQRLWEDEEEKKNENAKANKSDVKGSNGPAIKGSIVLM